MYARGILFGKMKYELGDHAIVRCPESGLEADIEFKVKGWVGGTYNAIGGYIKDTKSGKNLYELSGLWHGEMFIKDLSTGKKELLFDATHAKPSYPKSRPLDEQAPRESQKLWHDTTKAIKKMDHRGATDAKTAIEDEQRREAAERGDERTWKPKLFKLVPPGDEEQLDWIIDAHVDSQAPPQQQIEQILAIAPVIPGQEPSSDYQESKALPSQQGKTPAPSQSNDLIDFGQHDGASDVPAQPTTTATAPSSAAQQELKSQPPGKGGRVTRQDSLGNEEAFLDAES